VYTVVYLNNRWIKCDPSDDEEFAKNTCYLNPQSGLVEWDGVRDAILNLNREHILTDNHPIANIDLWMLKKPRHAKGIPLKVANLFIKFARKNKQKVPDVQNLEILFRKWLKINYPLHFFSFLLISWWKDFKSKSRRE
jgi:hypothetical protein